MARPLRIEEPGMWYHVMNRGNERRDIFTITRDYDIFLAKLNESCARFHVEIHSYVLMPNHFHLFLRTLEANLSQYMQQLSTAYTVWYNRRHDRVGHLFQGRYKSIILERDSYGAAVSRYIHLNPIRKILHSSLSVNQVRKKLRTYPWSSYPSILGLRKPLDCLRCDDILAPYAKTKRESRKRYARFVEEGLLGPVDNPFDDTYAGTVLGSESFLADIRAKLVLSPVKDNDTKGNKQKIISIPLHTILTCVSEEYNIDIEQIRNKQPGRKGNEARCVAFWLAIRHSYGAMNLKDIGREMGGCSNSNIVNVSKALENKMSCDPSLKKRIHCLNKKLIFNA